MIAPGEENASSNHTALLPAPCTLPAAALCLSQSTALPHNPLQPTLPQLFYARALALHLLEGGEPLLRWALHGLAAGVDAILEVGAALLGAHA